MSATHALPDVPDVHVPASPSYYGDGDNAETVNHAFQQTPPPHEEPVAVAPLPPPQTAKAKPSVAQKQPKV